VLINGEIVIPRISPYPNFKNNLTTYDSQNMRNFEVKFDEPEYRVSVEKVRNNFFVDFLIKKGLAKDRAQAMNILFAIIGLCIFVTIFFTFKVNNTNITKKNIFNPETASPDIK